MIIFLIFNSFFFLYWWNFIQRKRIINILIMYTKRFYSIMDNETCIVEMKNILYFLSFFKTRYLRIYITSKIFNLFLSFSIFSFPRYCNLLYKLIFRINWTRISETQYFSIYSLVQHARSFGNVNRISFS